MAAEKTQVDEAVGLEEAERAEETAAELTKAMVRLRARLRSETSPDELPATWSQLTTLARIVAQGPTTASELAQAEHVRRQSMAETLAVLRSHGLIDAGPDPDDKRKTLISATREGRALTATIPAAREAWLAATLRASISPEEQRVLRRASAIMNKIADA